MPEWDAVTVEHALRSAIDRLTSAGVASPAHDAEILLADSLDIERSGVQRLVILGSRMDGRRAADFDARVARRSAREPLQHITGRAHFRRVELAVGRGVFVPRPETELVAGFVIDFLRASGATASCVVDLCAGSGAIGVSVAHEVPGSTVHAFELSDDAVLWLGRNVEELKLSTRVLVHHEAAASAVNVLADRIGTIDAVVSNPPYVPLDAVIRDPEVLAHDPSMALWGGQDGLDVVRQVVDVATLLVRPDGVVAIEHADVQGESVPALLRSAVDDQGRPAWGSVTDHRDLADRPRYTTAVRQSSS